MPYTPQNEFVTFMLEQFGRPERNSAVQCDCERQSRRVDAAGAEPWPTIPRVWQKIADPDGRVAQVSKQTRRPREADRGAVPEHARPAAERRGAGRLPEVRRRGANRRRRGCRACCGAC